MNQLNYILIAFCIFSLTFCSNVSKTQTPKNAIIKKMLLQKEICLDNIDIKLDPFCEWYELNCGSCFDKDYYTVCTRPCDKNGQCVCDGQQYKWCQDNKEKCTKCFNMWEKCQCPEGLTLKIFSDSSRKCVLEDCHDGKWRTIDSKCTTCSDCDPKCKKCLHSATNCQECNEQYCRWEKNQCIDPNQEVTCPDGTFYQKKLTSPYCPECVTVCRDGTYPDSQTKKCQKCDDNCLSCNDESSCNRCKEGYCFSLGQCRKECPVGFYKKASNTCSFECVPCEQCPGDTYCNSITKSCDSNCLAPRFMWNKQCIKNCGHQFTTVGLRRELFEIQTIAQSGWQTSNSVDVSAALRVLGQWALFNPKGSTFTREFNNCPPKHTSVVIRFQYFRKSKEVGAALDADNIKILVKGQQPVQEPQIDVVYSDQSKLHVVTINSIDHTGTYLQLKIFVDKQPEGKPEQFYGINNVEFFFQNHNPLYRTGNECVPCEQCPTETYCNSATFTCDICPHPKVVENNVCTDTCNAPKFKSCVDKKCSCVSECPTKTFKNYKTGQCEPCLAPCEECVGNAHTCKFPCPQQKLFYNYQCVDECPEGTFAYDPTDKNFAECQLGKENCICGDCTDNCVKCVGTKSDQCFKCKEGFYLQDGECVKTCKQGKYADEGEKSCNCCNELCRACSGPQINQCSECNSGAHLIGTTCHASWKVQNYANQYTSNLKKVI